MKYHPPLKALLASILLPLMLTACEREPKVLHTQLVAFGTPTELTLVGVDAEKAAAVTHTLERDFAEMQRAWHAWHPGPVTRTNWLLSVKKRFSAPPSVTPLVQVSRDLAIKSEHLFNPAIGGLTQLWGFLSDDSTVSRPPPDPAVIAKLLAAQPRMNDITVDGYMLENTNPAVQLDFGAIEKGYGMNFAIAHLRELGVHNAIINAGGDLRAIGNNHGQPWRIAILGADDESVLGELAVSGDESVFTSGNVKRAFQWQGKRYHPILDPRTGYPAEGTRSVTVIHSDAATADAAATALYVAGPKDWPRIAARMGITQVLLVDNHNVAHMSPAMSARIKLTDPNMTVRVTALPAMP